MKNRFLMVLALVVLFGVLGVPNALADGITPVFNAPAAGSINTYPSSYGAAGGPVNLGLVFTANSNFTVNALGFYDIPGVTTQPEWVGLYNLSGTLLASALVTPSDPLVNGYFWQTIGPVGLTAGNQYTVVAFNGEVNGWGYGPAPTHGSEVTFNYDDYLYTNQLAFTTFTGGSGPAYYGPNIATTPEPSAFLLLGTGLVGFLGAMRRKLA